MSEILPNRHSRQVYHISLEDNLGLDEATLRWTIAEVAELRRTYSVGEDDIRKLIRFIKAKQRRIIQQSEHRSEQSVESVELKEQKQPSWEQERESREQEHKSEEQQQSEVHEQNEQQATEQEQEQKAEPQAEDELQTQEMGD